MTRQSFPGNRCKSGIDIFALRSLKIMLTVPLINLSTHPATFFQKYYIIKHFHSHYLLIFRGFFFHFSLSSVLPSIPHQFAFHPTPIRLSFSPCEPSLPSILPSWPPPPSLPNGSTSPSTNHHVQGEIQSSPLDSDLMLRF